MEYADGGDLQKVIATSKKNFSRIPEVKIWAFMRDILAALAHLHQKGILHRDLKSANIFINQGRFKLGISMSLRSMEAPLRTPRLEPPTTPALRSGGTPPTTAKVIFGHLGALCTKWQPCVLPSMARTWTSSIATCSEASTSPSPLNIRGSSLKSSPVASRKTQPIALQHPSCSNTR